MRGYKTTAAYLDVHTCVPPWHQLDHDVSQPMAAMALAKVNNDAELFQFMRDTHGGPLFGEGSRHFYWAGLCDGVEAQVTAGEHNVPFLDFDLLKIHPQMVNHGMGYYERWVERGDFPVTVIRPAHTYGEGGSLIHTFGWSTAFLDRLRKGKRIVVHGDASSLWCSCHIDDCARAFVAAL